MMISWTSVPVLALSFTLPALAGLVDEARHREAVYYADAYADHYHLPRELVHAIITQESGWNQAARSSLGAIGLMQLMPATACVSPCSTQSRFRTISAAVYAI